MKKRITLMIAALATMALLLSACQRGGVNSDDAALIRQQLEDVANRLNVVEDRIEELASDATGSEMLISQVRRELNQARTTLAEVDDKLAPTEPEITDDGLGTPQDAPQNVPDGLGTPLNDLNQSDAINGIGDSVNDLGNDMGDGFGQLQDDLEERLGTDEQMDDGTGQAEEAPLQPGAGGGATESVPGLPAAPGM